MKKILVNIYLSYIRFFAKLQLKKIKPLIIGIGGASGKSSLAQAVYSVLRHKYIVKTSKGKNSEQETNKNASKRSDYSSRDGWNENPNL